MSKRGKIIISSVLLLLFVLLSSSNAAEAKRFTIIQFNDVYEIFPVPALVNHEIELRGGLAYAGTLIRREQNKGPVLVLHAGDFLSPSLLSIKFKHKGAQMVEAMNELGVDFATFGNHEFDFGCEVLAQRIRESKFDWISANVKLPSEMNLPSDKVRPYRIKNIAGMRVGIFSVTVPMDPVGGCGNGKMITFSDPFEAARGVLTVLKRTGVDMIIALTHLRMTEDRKLAKMFPQIDFIVGGHDHEPMVEVAGKTLITKAGANALDLGMIGVKALRSGNEWIVEKHWKLEPVDPLALTPDVHVTLALEPYAHQIQEFNRVVGTSHVALDVREDTVRERESNFANFLTDAMREEMKTDIALINGGAFRGDRVIPPGSLTLSDLYTVLLFENHLRAIDIRGEELLNALENGVSQIGEKSGRFPQVSGLKFAYDADRPPGSRVLRAMIGDHPVDPEKFYSMATIDFLLERGAIDGYSLPKTNMRTGEPLNEVILRKLQNGPVNCQVEGRIMQE